MVQYIAAFRSRTQTMKLFQMAKQNRLPCSVINTPREASIGCGISVAYEPSQHPAMQKLFYRGGFNSFIGYYKVTQNGHRLSVEKL